MNLKEYILYKLSLKEEKQNYDNSKKILENSKSLFMFLNNGDIEANNLYNEFLPILDKKAYVEHVILNKCLNNLINDYDSFMLFYNKYKEIIIKTNPFKEFILMNFNANSKITYTMEKKFYEELKQLSYEEKEKINIFVEKHRFLLENELKKENNVYFVCHYLYNLIKTNKNNHKENIYQEIYNKFSLLIPFIINFNNYIYNNINNSEKIEFNQTNIFQNLLYEITTYLPEKNLIDLLKNYNISYSFFNHTAILNQSNIININPFFLKDYFNKLSFPIKDANKIYEKDNFFEFVSNTNKITKGKGILCSNYFLNILENNFENGLITLDFFQKEFINIIKYEKSFEKIKNKININTNILDILLLYAKEKAKTSSQISETINKIDKLKINYEKQLLEKQLNKTNNSLKNSKITIYKI